MTRSFFLLLLAACSAVALQADAKEPKPNVLFIAVDDLKHWVGDTGRDPKGKTPNIDRLSKVGGSVTRAYCAAPLCNPSRAALMSGIRPGTSGCYQNAPDWRSFIPEGRGLTVPFKNAGYFVAGAGKIYHSNTYYPGEFDEYFEKRDPDEGDPAAKGITRAEGFHTPVTHDIQDKDLADWHVNSGRLLAALEKTPHRHNPIVFLWSDHGWHLGEKSHWRKFALWEEATRMPLIWVVPGVTKPGGICERTVDLMSVYPTLCALAGIPVPAHVEGENIKPLLANPKASWNTPAVTTFGFQNHAVRTEQWRYIRYADGSEELYDHSKDPYEWTNLAGSTDTRKIRSELAKWLPAKNASEKNAPARTAGGGVGDPRGNGKKPTDLKRK